MENKKEVLSIDYKIKTYRWLFSMSLFQLLVCFILPVFLFPFQVLLSIELLIALTVGLLFGLFFWGVNIYGYFVDKRRRTLYATLTIFICLWIVWAMVTWHFIPHMHYLN